MRDNTWLENKMWEMLHSSFADVPITNDLVIKFGRKAKQRLGSIKRIEVVRPRFRLFGLSHIRQTQCDNPSVITITGYFKDSKIPEYVVLATIAHELVHYAHGFSSPLEQKYQHPHRGGVVRKELEQRDLGEMHRKARKWLKEVWREYLKRRE